jgi:hypothetical protein
LGDEAYAATFALKAAEAGFEFERASKPESAKGFVPIAKRWVVNERLPGRISSEELSKIMNTPYYLLNLGCFWLIRPLSCSGFFQIQNKIPEHALSHLYLF